jgi:hypothetical protein
MLRALLAYPQEALTSSTWYIACVLSVGCTNPDARTQYTESRLWSAF